GRVRRARGRLAEAREAFVRAADAQPGYEHAGYFLACAARVAGEAGDAPGRAALAEAALARDPGVARAQKAAAQSLGAPGRPARGPGGGAGRRRDRPPRPRHPPAAARARAYEIACSPTATTSSPEASWP